MASHKALRQGI